MDAYRVTIIVRLTAESESDAWDRANPILGQIDQFPDILSADVERVDED